MVLKLHGFSGSTCTQRVKVVLKEKNVPFEFVPVNLMTGEHKQSDHMKKQPYVGVSSSVTLNIEVIHAAIDSGRFPTSYVFPFNIHT